MKIDLPEAIVAEMRTVLHHWHATRIGRIKREANRTIWEEMIGLGVSEVDIVWMAYWVALCIVDAKEKTRLRSELSDAKDTLEKEHRAMKCRAKILDSAWDMLDETKRNEEMAGWVTRCFKAQGELKLKERRVHDNFCVNGPH